MAVRKFTEAPSKNDLITVDDFNRLSSLFEATPVHSWDAISDFDEKLQLSTLIKPTEAPSDLVTMNSRVYCQLASPDRAKIETTQITLVYPKDADIIANKISVLTPLGKALIGRRIGEFVVWSGNDGFQRRLKLVKMDYQPETNAHWHL